MQLLIVAALLTYIITLYFRRNPLKHTKQFMWKRFLSWFPLGMTYSFMYMARYNVDQLATKNAGILTFAEKSQISGAGFTVYALALFLTGPLIDRIGGKKGMIMAALGAAISNIAMGWALYLHMHGSTSFNLVFVLTIFYSVNMFFQSFGAISTIKVKSFWFHVRERGTFGAIFGTLISLGVYFAFDWTNAICKAVNIDLKDDSLFHTWISTVFGLEGATVSAFWVVFFIPAGFLLIWALVDLLLIKDSPDQAGFGKFETYDASAGQSLGFDSYIATMKAVLTNRVLLMIGIIELTSGVLRDGVMKNYRPYADKTSLGWEFLYDNWGLVAAATGILGSFAAGWISDRYFHSRRAPVAGIMQSIMFVAVLAMLLTIWSDRYVVGIAAMVIMMAVIGVHSIMSGTATADFGGRKQAATATGVADGFSKIGTAVQEAVLGIIISPSTWHYWPAFLLPFTILGLFFAIKLWRELPEATKKYIREIEKLKV